MFRNAENETMECYEMIHKLIYALTFRNILLHFVSEISTFRFIPVINKRYKRSRWRSFDYGDVQNNCIWGKRY